MCVNNLSSIALYDRLKERYKPQRVVADELGIPVQAIGRITSSFKCERGSRDKCVDYIVCHM